MNKSEILHKLNQFPTPKGKEHMSRVGLPADKALGITIQDLRNLAKEIGKDHALSLELWNEELHEAKLLAVLLAEPKKVTEELMEAWASQLYSWDITDHCCNNLFDKTPFAYTKAVEWTSRSEEFVKRAGFTLIATLGVHDKKAKDAQFEAFFTPILQQATDERNYVKKAINWALRQIGKRNMNLNQKAIQIALSLQKMPSPAAKWIAADALRELKNERIQTRLKQKGH
jgi:3-methyladenine DNA glycosylase AlkD